MQLMLPLVLQLCALYFSFSAEYILYIWLTVHSVGFALSLCVDGTVYITYTVLWMELLPCPMAGIGSEIVPIWKLKYTGKHNHQS